MSKCISACRILSRYIATLSIIFIISPPANQLYRWSRNSRRAKALFSGSVTLHIAKIAKIYLTKCHRKRNVLRHSTRSWPGNGRHVWHIFLLWPLGWADFFSEKFFFFIGTPWYGKSQWMGKPSNKRNSANFRGGLFSAVTMASRSRHYVSSVPLSLFSVMHKCFRSKALFCIFSLRDEYHACSTSRFRLNDWKLSDALEKHILTKRKGGIYLQIRRRKFHFTCSSVQSLVVTSIW